jgi:hypothetical protein
MGRSAIRGGLTSVDGSKGDSQVSSRSSQSRKLPGSLILGILLTACGGTTPTLSHDSVDGGGTDAQTDQAVSDIADANADNETGAALCTAASGTASGEWGFSVVSVLAGTKTDLTGKTYLDVLLYNEPVACGECAASYRRLELQLYAKASAVVPGTFTITETTSTSDGRVSYRDWLGDCQEGGGFESSGTGTIVLSANDGSVRGTYDLTFLDRDGGTSALKGTFDTQCACSAP